MNKKASTFLVVVGFLFLINAIAGRYLVLPGYLAGLEQGAATLGGARQAASAWEIVRYLLWAYSFKLGIYGLILGAMFRTDMTSARKWVIGVGGFVYIAFAYMPLPGPASLVFGLAGGLMAVLMVFVFLGWGNGRSPLHPLRQTASDHRMAGYFFFGMATYTLCPLLGVKTFALSPEKMIAYGLQGEAASFAFHLLIELLLGWICIALSFYQEKKS